MKEIGFRDLFRATLEVGGRGTAGSEFMCGGVHGVNCAGGAMREGLVPGHLREGDRVSRSI